MKHSCKRILAVLLTVLVLLAGAVGLYLGDYYHALPEAAQAAAMAEADGNRLLFRPDRETDTGIIFYPGGKVDPAAYAPLLAQLSRQGIFCVLQKMPGNLAVLNPDAAKDIPAAFPEITRWYIAGHSLGGSMAAHFAANHPEAVEGILLLAAYSTDPVENLRVLSIYGSEDGVLNREKYAANRSNLPADFTEQVIDGGNHAFFGSYGPQKGDGEGKITPLDQQDQTAWAIWAFLNEEAD